MTNKTTCRSGHTLAALMMGARKTEKTVPKHLLAIPHNHVSAHLSQGADS